MITYHDDILLERSLKAKGHPEDGTQTGVREETSEEFVPVLSTWCVGGLLRQWPTANCLFKQLSQRLGATGIVLSRIVALKEQIGEKAHSMGLGTS